MAQHRPDAAAGRHDHNPAEQLAHVGHAHRRDSAHPHMRRRFVDEGRCPVTGARYQHAVTGRARRGGHVGEVVPPREGPTADRPGGADGRDQPVIETHDHRMRRRALAADRDAAQKQPRPEGQHRAQHDQPEGRRSQQRRAEGPVAAVTIDEQHGVDPHQDERCPAAEAMGRLEPIVVCGAQPRQCRDDHDREHGGDGGAKDHVGG